MLLQDQNQEQSEDNNTYSKTLQGKAVHSGKIHLRDLLQCLSFKEQKINQRHYSLVFVSKLIYIEGDIRINVSPVVIQHRDCSRRFCSFNPYSGRLSPFHLSYVAIHIIPVYKSGIQLDVAYKAKIRFISSLTNAECGDQISNSRLFDLIFKMESNKMTCS